jgi:cytochrome c oxidase subunit 1
MSWLSLSRPEVLFAIGALCLLAIAAFALIASETLGSMSVDLYLLDVYVVMSWVHLLLLAAILFALFVVLYHWFPEFVGRSMSNPLGQIHFWLTFLSACGVILLTMCQDRHAPARMAVGLLVSVLLGLLGQAIFLINLCWSLFKGSLD